MTRTEYDVVALGELLIDFTAQGAGADGCELSLIHNSEPTRLALIA